MNLNQLKGLLPYFGILIIFSCIIFYPELQGKKLGSHDSVSWYGAGKELLNYQEKGEDIKWTNRVFSGMPLYSIGGEFYGNVLMKIYYKSVEVFPTQIVNMFLIFSCIFLALLLLKINRNIAFFSALAFGLNTWIIDSLIASHSSKILAIAFLSLVFSGYLAFVQRKSWAGLISIGIGLMWAIGVNHVQIVYYGAMAMGLMVLGLLIIKFKEGEIIDFFKKNLIILPIVIIAILGNLSSLWVLKDYSKDTMRGGKTELIKPEANSTSKEGGLDINYAFSWSYTPQELFNFIVPDAMGGSSNYKVKPGKSRLGDAIGRDSIPLYWGEQPFTGGPNYIGFLVFFAVVFTMFYWKNPIRFVFLSIIFLFGIMGLGKHFLEFNELFFNYLPFYNKFRTPTMSYSMINLSVVFLVAFGLNHLILNYKNEKEHVLKSLKLSAYTIGGILIIGYLMIQNLGFTSSQDMEMFQNNTQILQLVIEDRIQFFKADWFRSLILFLVGLGLIWGLMKEMISKNAFIYSFGILMILELWNVSNRFYDKNAFLKCEKIEDLVPNESYNTFMVGDTTHFRMINTTTNVFNDNTDGYRYSNIGGYSPAKLYRYQDLIDMHLSKMNMNVLNMLNMKYFVSEQNGEKVVQQNPDACGNVWFPKRIQYAKNANEEMDSIGVSNPKQTVWVDTRYQNETKFDANPDTNTSIYLSKYHPDHMEYISNSTNGGYAVFSEIWYRGNEEWNLYIDGKKEKMIRTNYLLRGAYIPAGTHKIEMKFEVSQLDLYKKISIASSWLLFLSSIAFLILINRKNKNA
jgi:hypothetical protein